MTSVQREVPTIDGGPSEGSSLNSICVFCGSSPGKNPIYQEAAKQLGELLANSNIQLVYGGGDKGLMGAIARTVASKKGKIIGIIPETMKQFEGMMMVGEVILVPDMHTRKRLMNEKADGFIALPGGFGTFEELLEIVTWAQLNIHRKPIGVLNVADYFTPLIALLETGVREGFIQPANMELIIFRSDPAELLRAMQAYRTPEGAGYNLSWGDAKGLS